MEINRALNNFLSNPAQAIPAAVAAVAATVGLVFGISAWVGELQQEAPAVEYVNVNDTYADTELTPGFEGNREVPIESLEKVGDNQVRVGFLGGAECFGYSADVVETAESVDITIKSGVLPAYVDPDNPCDFVGIYRAVTIDLDAPIADRVVNGQNL